MHRRTVWCLTLSFAAVVAAGVIASAQERQAGFSADQARAVATLVRQSLTLGLQTAPVPPSLQGKAPGRLLVSAFKSGARAGALTADLPTLADSATDVARQLSKAMAAGGDVAAAANASVLCVEVVAGTREVRLATKKTVRTILDVGNEGLSVAAGNTRWFSPLTVLCNADSPTFLESLYREIGLPAPDLTAEGVRTEAFTTQAYVEKAPGGEMTPFVMGNVSVGPVTTDTVRHAVLGGGAWIMGMRESDGKFMERYDPLAAKALLGTDAVVELNAARSLYWLYAAVLDKDVLDAANKMVDLVKTKHVLEGEGAEPFSFVKYGTREELGPSVALLRALCDRASAAGKVEDRTLMERLGRFIRHMTSDNGALHLWLKHKAANEPPPESTEGTAEEAILALCALCELTPAPDNAVWKQSAEKILKHELDALGTDGVPDPRLVEALARLYGIGQDARYADQCLELAQRLESRLYRPGADVSPGLVGGLMSEGGPFTAETAMTVKALTMAYDLAAVRNKADAVDPRPIIDAVRFVMAQQYRPENSFYFQGRDSLQGAFRAGARDTFVSMETTRRAMIVLLDSMDFVASYGVH